jgi:iron(III) transport system substrate-binding protein
MNTKTIRSRQHAGRKMWLQPALLLLLSALAAPLFAQSQILMYQGADRTQKLIEGAKKEGALTLYSSMTERDTSNVVRAFEEKYGVKVGVWRSGKDKVLQRVISEGRAGRDAADVVWNVGPEMEALHREKMLQPAWSPMLKNLIPQAVQKHGEWAGAMVYIFVQAYNPKRVTKEELPRTWDDLLDPRWKGRLGIEFKQQEWFYRLLTVLGEKKGLDLFHKLVATNGLSVRMGSSVLANSVMTGETDFAVTMYSFLVDQGKARGGDIEAVALAPTIALTDGLGIPKNIKHPYGAMLFYDFLLGDGQKILSDNLVATTTRGDPVVARFMPVYIEPAKVLDDYARWTKLYDDTIRGTGAVGGAGAGGGGAAAAAPGKS